MPSITRRTLAVFAALALVPVGVSFAPPVVAASTGPDPAGTVYVVNELANAIDIFAPGATGNVAPERSIQGPGTGLSIPADVKVDSAGDVYVANSGDGSITEYPPQASGDATPICTISGPNTGLAYNGPDDFSLEADGTLVVGTYLHNSVLVFAPESCGNVAPVKRIAGSNTGFGGVIDGVGTDAAGNIFVVDTKHTSVDVFPAGANGDGAPAYAISGSQTGLSGPDDAVVGFNGELYVTNGYDFAPSAITVYSAGASGNAPPIQDITGSNTGFKLVDDLAVDDSGNIYVTDYKGNDVAIFAADATGNVPPTAVIAGSKTTFDGPEGVAVAGAPGPPAGANVTTSVAASSISVDQSTSDTATVTKGTNGTSPTGSLVFKLFGPNDPTCSNAPAYVSPAQTVDGARPYTSPSFKPPSVGTYSWQALYSGDTHNAAVTTACNDSAETVTVKTCPSGPTVTLAPSTQSFDEGGIASVVATVDNGCGIGIPGVPVTFTITGPNAGTSSITTDAKGKATLADSDVSSGTDTITASFTLAGTFTSRPATVVWTDSAPVVTVSVPGVVAVNTSATFTGSFTDLGKSVDTYTATWDWGDGSTTTVQTGVLPSTNLSASHTYTSEGGYTVTLTVADEEGYKGSATGDVAVFNPGAGFVTGGGWINSGAGACGPAAPSTCRATTAGKAEFGFVSKYHVGASTPSGQTQFQFQAGELNFHSSAYSLLLIDGTSGFAQYDGTGTVNGNNGFSFTVTAYDHDISNSANSVDGFRMQIWDSSGGLVYDNCLASGACTQSGSLGGSASGNTQPLGGGSVVIHRS